jgi:hypothetical protein
MRLAPKQGVWNWAIGPTEANAWGWFCSKEKTILFDAKFSLFGEKPSLFLTEILPVI